jgi:hypothetical protein
MRGEHVLSLVRLRGRADRNGVKTTALANMSGGLTIAPHWQSLQGYTADLSLPPRASFRCPSPTWTTIFQNFRNLLAAGSIVRSYGTGITLVDTQPLPIHSKQPLKVYLDSFATKAIHATTGVQNGQNGNEPPLEETMWWHRTIQM